MNQEPHNPSAMSEEFLRLYTREQFRIAGFVRSLVPDPADASDIMQETSMALLRNFHQYESGRDFANWAFGVARHQVLKHWRSKRRERLVFSEAFVNDLADETWTVLSTEPDRFQALRECIRRLTSRQRDLIKDFYGHGISAAAVAKQWNCNLHAVYNSLRAVRKELHQCILNTVAQSNGATAAVGWNIQYHLRRRNHDRLRRQ